MIGSITHQLELDKSPYLPDGLLCQHMHVFLTLQLDELLLLIEDHNLQEDRVQPCQAFV